ncbi:MAG: primase C-terminal domain-containing protein [Methanobrevibacter arboriphilus]|uniref:Primase C-terminal domain-containing protein n=1 Tax=Methanobrevibacter arboriphilus TaxID=39441 RepID=A0A843AMT5_METAZ|nr:primase C-terminal domain-containing protein [Methanobrevibacter arboriphilus]MBF4468828.1 primase C-terminal domain-containing protein [Methanobrevibacter arboriphilus]
MKQPACLPLFIKQTPKGERNHNLFQAINHLRRFNNKISTEQLTKQAILLNNHLNKPLQEKEIKTITEHVTKTHYKSTCKKFNEYCKKCNLGSNKQNYNQKNNYWKTIRKDNTIIKKLTNGVKLYPWDIEDTNNLDETQKELILELREQKGINPIIDTVLKLRGIKIGDEALKEFLGYKQEGYLKEGD